jgi:hypothetical protein
MIVEVEMQKYRRLMTVRCSFEWLEDLIAGKFKPFGTNLPDGFRVVAVKEDRYVPGCARLIIEHESFRPNPELADPPDFSSEFYLSEEAE